MKKILLVAITILTLGAASTVKAQKNVIKANIINTLYIYCY